MITKYIVEAVLAAVSSLFSLIPNTTLPTIPSPDGILGFANEFSRIFPISWLFVMIAGSVVISLALNAWDLIFFTYHQFWGSD